MKTVILCGGLGSRLSEETQVKPKPMVEIGARPILWHIMKIYEHAGFTDFVLALGYKGEFIKDYFLNYRSRTSDISVHLASGETKYKHSRAEDWNIQLTDTGTESMTGGRLHRLEPSLKEHGTFMLTYGDGLANIDINAVVDFHKSHGKLATVTAVRPPARFGAMNFDGDKVVDFHEKPQTEAGWINGGFFVFEPGVFDYLHGDMTILEKEPLENMARDGELFAYKHEGFWQPMDTLRDKDSLNEAWNDRQALWKVWESS